MYSIHMLPAAFLITKTGLSVGLAEVTTEAVYNKPGNSFPGDME